MLISILYALMGFVIVVLVLGGTYAVLVGLFTIASGLIEGLIKWADKVGARNLSTIHIERTE